MMLPNQVWQLTGKDQSGPNVMVLGGTHGDELTGIELVRHMLSQLGLLNQPSGAFERNDVIGNLFLGFGNPEAILRKTRGASAVRNLNRCFVPEELDWAPTSDDPLDRIRARELAPLFRQTDFLFDIHSTSNPSPPFVCFDRESPEHQKLYRQIPVDYVLTDPKGIVSQDDKLPVTATTDYYVDHLGGSAWSEKMYGKRKGVGLCYETGQANDVTQVQHALDVVMGLLKSVGVVQPAFAKAIHQPNPNQSFQSDPAVYALSHCVSAKQSKFSYAKGMDCGWKQVKAGQPLGSYANGEKVLIEASGMLLFPKAREKIREGKSLYYIAQKAQTTPQKHPST